MAKASAIDCKPKKQASSSDNGTAYYKAVREFWDSSPDKTINERRLTLAYHDELTKHHLADNLMRFRRHLLLSQSAMAGLLHVSLSQYKKYESGQEIMRYDVAMRLSLKCGLPNFCLLRGSPYADYIPLPAEYVGFDRVWFYANTLTDTYFNRLCQVLACFIDTPFTPATLKSGVTIEDFDGALAESEDRIYLAIAQGIRALRDHLGFSQEYVAECMDVSLSRYQEYERATTRPRFNLLVAARYGIAMGINPFHVLVGTKFAKVRTMQNARIAAIQEIVQHVDDDTIHSFMPMVEGFYSSVKNLPNAIYFAV